MYRCKFCSNEIKPGCGCFCWFDRVVQKGKRTGLVATTLLVTTLAHAATLEVSITGLDCQLCSEEMKAKLAHVAGARSVEPKLECGRLYLDMAPGAKLNVSGLSFTLLANGFTVESVKPVEMSFADVKAMTDC